MRNFSKKIEKLEKKVPSHNDGCGLFFYAEDTKKYFGLRNAKFNEDNGKNYSELVYLAERYIKYREDHRRPDEGFAVFSVPTLESVCSIDHIYNTVDFDLDDEDYMIDS